MQAGIEIKIALENRQGPLSTDCQPRTATHAGRLQLRCGTERRAREAVNSRVGTTAAGAALWSSG